MHAASNDLTFNGQQEGENVLSVLSPHWSREALSALIIIACGLILAYGFRLALASGYLTLPPQSKMAVLAALLVFTFIMLFVNHVACGTAKVIVTDRRIIRIEGIVPGWENRRALFWSDVTKTRARAPNVLLRLINVGVVDVIPNFDAQNEWLYVPYVYYFNDFASYLEKIMYEFKQDRNAVASKIRPFVAKPKGKRYPLETRAA